MDAEDKARIEAYNRKVKELTAERDHYAAQLAQERRDRTRQERILRTQRDEVLGPELAARDHLLSELRAQVAQQKARYDSMYRKYEKIGNYFLAQQRSTGLEIDEALEALISVVTDDDGLVQPRISPRNNLGNLRGLTDQQVQSLGVKAGTRRPGKLAVIEDPVQALSELAATDQAHRKAIQEAFGE